MQTNMHFQTSWGREAFHTVLALKSLNAGVCFYVCCESTLYSKGSKTLWAFEWLFMSVNANVSHKITGFFKFFRAVWTYMPSYSIFLTYGPWNTITEQMLTVFLYIWNQIYLRYKVIKTYLKFCISPQMPPTLALNIFVGKKVEWCLTQQF